MKGCEKHKEIPQRGCVECGKANCEVLRSFDQKRSSFDEKQGSGHEVPESIPAASQSTENPIAESPDA